MVQVLIGFKSRSRFLTGVETEEHKGDSKESKGIRLGLQLHGLYSEPTPLRFRRVLDGEDGRHSKDPRPNLGTDSESMCREVRTGLLSYVTS